jgi:hypothetical protein
MTWSFAAPCSGSTLGIATVADTFEFARRVDAKIIWGLDLRAADPATAADEANAIVDYGGNDLIGFEIGNEPNDWTTESRYEAEWQQYVNAIKERTGFQGFVGPSMYDFEGQSWFSSYTKRERALLSLVTYHYYSERYNAANGSPQEPSIANLLSPTLMKRSAQDLKRVVVIARQNGLPLVIDETNSVNDGGVAGISDTTASALWMTDYLFTAAEQGALSVNIHGSGGGDDGSPYAPIRTLSVGAHPTASPDYYGMYLFHLATGDGNTTPISAPISSAANVTAHAVRDTNGDIQLALINKDAKAAVSAHVSLEGLSQHYRVTRVVRLSGPGLTATSGLTLGGSAIQPDGSWRATTTVETIPMNGSTLTIYVPQGSAILLTLAPIGG